MMVFTKYNGKHYNDFFSRGYRVIEVLGPAVFMMKVKNRV